MTLSNRQKITGVLLAIYWPALFISAHMPVPKVVLDSDVSDKSLHFLAYLILVFLLWFTVGDGKKVNWRSASPWWVFLTMVAYGVVDEWLQLYAAGRSCSVWDFLVDMTGTLTGLCLFSVLAFWPAGLAVTAITIFSFANVSRTNLADTMPAASAAFVLSAYAILTAFWVQCLHLFAPRNRLRPNKVRWVTAALSAPLALMLTVRLFSVILGKDFPVRDMILSTGAIVAVVVTIGLAGLLREVKEPGAQATSQEPLQEHS
ncbi:MAG: VanZ family protein [Planctomycetota bacterium]